MDSNQEILDYINAIENQINIETFDFFSFNIWPIVRTELIKENRTDLFPIEKKLSLKSILSHAADIFLIWKLFSFKNKHLFLLYGTNQSGKVQLQNQIVDKEFTPFRDRFGATRIKLFEFGFRQNNLQKVKGVLNVNIFYLLYCFILYPTFYIQNKTLDRKIKEKLMPLKFLKETTRIAVEKQVKAFFTKKRFFSFLLHLIKPQSIFVKSFNNVNSFALVAAANNLRINTIEYQHGQQNILTYSHWINVPKEGFKMIPKYFWVWEDIFKKKFENWMKTQDFHQVFTGGNLWSNYVKKKLSKRSLRTSNNEKHILVCLQQNRIPKLVLAAIKKSESIIWHIRLHPRERVKKNQIEEVLVNEKINPSKYELNNANKWLFEELILAVDAVVAEWSTVVYEAYSYHKKGIVVSQNGKDAYEHFIKENKIFYTPNADSLLKTIHSNKVIPVQNRSTLDMDMVSQILLN